jgi:hypothetical protein
MKKALSPTENLTISQVLCWAVSQVNGMQFREVELHFIRTELSISSKGLLSMRSAEMYAEQSNGIC